jgi:Fic family protein
MTMNWPQHTVEQVAWKTAVDAQDRGGRRPPIEDRMLAEISVSIPPLIAELDPQLDRPTREAVEEAQIAAVRLDASGGPHLAALSGFLLRSESVASSKIERINPDPAESAKAFAGIEAGRDARLVAAAATAVTSLINSPRPLDPGAIMEAHRLLLSNDPSQANELGQYRDVQNWIGGSDFSPRNALYVPPPAGLVESLMDDLTRFAARTDFGALAQAAVLHAQFESIHPFTDGNGRIGRALINTLLRHRNVTNMVVVPVASVMLADVDGYFNQLGRYREGDANAFIVYLARALVAACDAAEESAHALADLPERWLDAARPRAKSSAALLIEVLAASPVVTSASAGQLIGTTPKATLGGLDQLESAGVLTEITGNGRDRVWVAHDVLDEMDRLDERIGKRQRPTV